MNANRINKNRILTIATFAVFLVILVVTLVFVKNPVDSAYGAYPDWCGEYKVAISFNQENLVQEDTLKESDGYVHSTAIADIVCGIPYGSPSKDVRVRVRTRNGTAVAGVDYTPIDSIVTLRRSSFIKAGNEEPIYYDNVSVKVETNVERFIVDGVRPYFDIEIYDVLNEGFSIAENAKSVRVYVASVAGKEHYYSTTDANGEANFKLDMPEGIYFAILNYNGNIWYSQATGASKITITPSVVLNNVYISGNDFIQYYGENKYYIINFNDTNAYSLDGKIIQILISSGDWSKSYAMDMVSPVPNRYHKAIACV